MEGLEQGVTMIPVDVNDPQVAFKIRSNLENFGCCHVNFPEPLPMVKTNELLCETFPQSRGHVFSDYWKKHKKFSQSHIWGYSCKMPYPPVLQSDARGHFKLEENVYVKNPLVAKNSIQLWETIIERYPQLRPSYDRYNVSEDGVKISSKQSYKTTPLHFDGHCPNERIQIIYCEPSESANLYVVPGSHTLRTKEGFVRIHDDDEDTIRKYGVCMTQPGLQMFKGSVWHFEDGNPKESEVFRHYCGIVEMPGSEIPQLIRCAYLREHGWAFDPFARENKHNRHQGLFVNDKSNQSSVVFDDYELLRPEFQQLKGTSVQAMKNYLNQQCSDLRLELYGLKRTDL